MGRYNNIDRILGQCEARAFAEFNGEGVDFTAWLRPEAYVSDEDMVADWKEAIHHVTGIGKIQVVKSNHNPHVDSYLAKFMADDGFYRVGIHVERGAEVDINFSFIECSFQEEVA